MLSNQRRPISPEGKIGILLALLAIGGAGALQVFPHPYNDYVGWTLIWVAIVGAVALGVYHVVTTVAPPRYVPPRHKRPEMTAAEIGFLAALGATAVSLIALGLRQRMLPLILALIACVAVAFDFVDRTWFWEAAPTEEPLASANARLDVSQWIPVLNEQNKQLALNVRVANNGKATITQWSWAGMTANGIAGLVDPDIIDGIFVVLQRKLIVQVPVKMDLNPGQNDQFFTVPNTSPFVQMDDNTLQAYKNGTYAVYFAILMKSKDTVVSKGKFIYAEHCVYLTQNVVHNCPTHNHNYIAN